MRVLVVDDQPEVAEALVRGLREAGFNAEGVASGEEALAVTNHSDAPYDVVILDVMLGRGVDGIHVCRILRSRALPIAVLMLTARDEITDRLAGFDAGADDYLAKPYEFEEILARVRALGRRWVSGTEPGSTGDVLVDPGTRCATVRGTTLELTRKEFDVLELFVRHPGQVLLKSQIHDYAWSADVTPDSTIVDTYVGRVRRKLFAAQSDHTLETVRGVGYRLSPVVPRVP